MPSVQTCTQCKVTLLRTPNSRSGEHMRPHYSEDTDSYTAQLDFNAFYTPIHD